MVAHEGEHVVERELAVGLDPERHPVVGIFAPCVIFVLGHFGGVGFHEAGPHAGFASAQSAESERAVGVGKAEVFKLAFIQPDGLGVVHHIGRVHAFHGRQVVFLGQVFAADRGLAVGRLDFGDAGLVGMAGDVTVGNPVGYPYGTGVAFGVDFAVLAHDLLAFPYHFHDPDFVGVLDRERFPGGGISVGAGQLVHDFDGFTRGLGTLQSDVNQASIVDDAGGVNQLGKSAEGGFSNGNLVFVDVPYHRIGVQGLFYLA